MRSAEEYTISIRLESIEGDRLYVARIEEFPDVEEYADTYEFARELALDTIRTSQKVFSEKGMLFPEPKEFSPQPEASGRVTLRLPRSLHAKCIVSSENEGVSLNSYLVSLISSKNNENDTLAMIPLLKIISNELAGIKKDNGFNKLLYKQFFTHASSVKTFASVARLENTEEDRTTLKIRDFLSSSIGKQQQC